MEYRILKQRNKQRCNTEIINDLIEQFSMSTLCAHYLTQKGISSLDEAEEFLHPAKRYLSDPFLFSDMRKSVDRINGAIQNNEKIVIYGDYDCDGICASVILYKAIKEKTENVSCFLPDRFIDGYGMNIERIKEIAQNKANLIITVDNGITACSEIELAAECGIDVILTDHHECTQAIPHAYSVINPKAEGERYPFNELCGAGVALKLAQGIGIKDTSLYDELITFAAVASVADLVPLTGENRILVSVGLKLLKDNRNRGLSELIKLAQLKPENITSGTVAFQIAPRINAAGRMKNAYMAFELFTSDDEKIIKENAVILNDCNEARKQSETEIEDKCKELIEKNNLLDKNTVLFIALPNAHEGVIGIAAGKISEQYHRPSVVGSIKDGKITASARSLPGFNIFEALRSAEDLYIKFGGHEQAAGFTVLEGDFEKLTKIVNQKACEMGISSYLYRTCCYDIEAITSNITKKAVEELEFFSPYGIKNPKPVFKLDDVKIRNISYIGANSAHVKCSLLSGNDNIPAIAFSAVDMFKGHDFDNDTFDVMFTPSLNTFNGITRIQAELKDISLHIECPESYYESLYEHFHANANTAVDYIPSKEEISADIPESVLKPCEKIFIVYGKDMLMRAIRYAGFISSELNINYSLFTNFEASKINILVNPINENFDDISQEITVLDEPCFCGYESRLYNGIGSKRFLKSSRYMPAVNIDRDYIAFIYKKLRMLEYLNNNCKEFIGFLNRESEMKLNYFSLRICFDIMSEMDIIDYEMIEDKIFVDFKPVKGSIDINASTVMMKLKKFNS